MNKQEQIEEMAFDLCVIDTCKHLTREECADTTCAHCEAEALYNAGYRRQDEVAREIFAEVLSLVDEIGLSANEVCHAQMLSGEAIRGTPDTMRSFGKLAGIKRVRDAILELKTKYEVQEDEQARTN